MDINRRFGIILDRLTGHGPIAIDVETSGLDWRTNHIVGYVVTFSPDPADSYYLPVRHAPGGNLGGAPGPQEATGWAGNSTIAEKALLEALDHPENLLFGHNLAFDLKFLQRAGMTKLNARFEDTMINAPLLNEWQARFSLDFCAREAGVQAKKGDEIIEYMCRQFPEVAAKPRTAMGHFWRLAGDDPMAVAYAEGDGTTTWQLRDWQNKHLHQQELLKVHDIESRLIPVLARMSFRGIKIHEERLRTIAKRIELDIERLMEKFPADFNVKSPLNVQKWCVDNGVTDWPLTPKGKPSFPEEWLDTHEPGKKIVQVRRLKTLKTSFIDPMQETHLWNGRVHTSFNQLRGDEYGTVTGRLSSSEPNLQQVPKRNEDLGRIFRSIFIPDEGMTWGSVDYSQCEPRLLAYYSQSKVLTEGYTSDPPVDAHTAVAIACFGDASKANRDYGKRINQTLITGGGKGVIVKKYRVKPEEVDDIWDKYFERMPEIKQLQKRAARRMEERGFVRSLLGRKARLFDRNKSYTAVNRLLQCGNADIIKLKMVEVDEYLASIGRPIDMLNNVHDAIDYQFPEEHRSVYKECLDMMQDFGPGQAIELTIPILVDHDEGPDWAIATYGQPSDKINK